VKGIDLPPNGELHDLKVENKGKGFTLAARVTADPAPYAVLGYMDPDGGGDYDATSCSAIPDKDGNFTLEANALAPGKSGVFRVVVLQVNGAASSFAGATTPFTYPYIVAKDGTVDLSATRARMQIKPLMDAMAKNDSDAAAKAVANLEASSPEPLIIEAAKVLATSLTETSGPPPAEAGGSICRLSDARPFSAKVGYGRAIFNRLPEDGLLFSCASRLFARGIYAHAPAQHVWNLDGKWQAFTAHAGLPDGRDGGSCVFVVKGDGKELWRSERTEAGQLVSLKLPVEGVKQLELIVEDAGDGNGSDWGCWFDPAVSR